MNGRTAASMTCSPPWTCTAVIRPIDDRAKSFVNLWPDRVVNVMCFQQIRKSDQHGEGFYYVVSYKRRDVSNAAELKINVTGWQQSELVIDGQEMFKEYEISVQSANSRGLAPSHSVVRKLGYSGQAGMSTYYFLSHS